MKVTFKNPVDYIEGKMGGDNVYKRGDSYVCKAMNALANPVSYFSRQIMQFFDAISVMGDLIFGTDKTSWEEYYPWLKKSKNWRNAFMANNIQLNYPFASGIEVIQNITLPAENPHMPNCFDAWYDEEGDSVVFSWLDDYESEIYIIGAYFKRSIRAKFGSPNPKISIADVASLEQFSLGSSFFTYSTSFWVTIRSLNIRGEVSPWCPAIEVDLPDPPDVDFSADPRSGESPLVVSFSNLTTGKVNKWLWDFGDGYISPEKNPVHVYDGSECYFRVRLTAWGVAASKKTLSKSNYIHITEDENWDTVCFVCDSDHNRIFKRLNDGFSYISKIGSLGSGNDEFIRPFSCCADQDYVYIVDQLNHRIVKRLKSDLSYVSKIGSEGSGDDQFQFPMGITCDDVHLFICDLNNARIHKRLKSDLSLVQMLDSIPSGTGRFQQPWGISCDYQYVYFTDVYYDVVLVFTKSNFSFVNRIDLDVLGAKLFNNPKNILVDSAFMWVVNFDSPGFSVKKLLKGTNTLQGTIFTSILSYEDTFVGMATNSSFIWLTDLVLNLVYRYDRITLSLLSTYGESNEGNNGYDTPRGLSIASPFTIP